MKYILKVYNIWECGQRIDSEGNPHQEDCIFPAYEQQKDTDRLFILCDGMGGHDAGEVASYTVCSTMSKSILRSAPDAEGDFNDEILKQAIADAFNALDALFSDDVSAEKKMGTTMTFLKFHNHGCTIAHMGDSRVYHIRPGKGREDTKILFKTNDHSLVNDLIKVGELTPEEAKLSKQKNIITRAMQPKMERHPKPDIYHTTDIKEGDYFYMCSDGMLEQMEDENLLFNFSEATGDDENKVKILTQATSQNLDNHSAIIIHVLDVIDPLAVEDIKPSTASGPDPIMAKIDDEDINNSPQSSEDNAIAIGKSLSSDNTLFEHPQKRNKAINKWLLVKNYTLFVLFLIILVAGMLFVWSKFSKDTDSKPEKTETPQKKSRRQGRHPNSSNQIVNPSSQEANKPVQTNQDNNAANSSVPTKIQNAISSSHLNQADNNNSVHANLQFSANGSGSQPNNQSGISVSNSNTSDDDVVSSDEQVAIDAAKKKKK